MNIVTTSYPNKLNWKNAEHPCLARKNLMYPPLTPEVLHNLQCWSESEVKVKRKLLPNLPEQTSVEIQREKGMSSSPNTAVVRTRFWLARKKGALNSMCKGIQAQLDPNTGRFELVA